MEQHEDILVRPHSLISDPLDRTNTLVQHAACLRDNASQRSRQWSFHASQPKEARIYTHIDELLEWTGREQGTNTRSTVECTHEKEHIVFKLHSD